MKVRLTKKARRRYRMLAISGAGVLGFALLVYVAHQQFFAVPQQFPVTVDPHSKKINESYRVNNFLAKEHSLFRAASVEVDTGGPWNSFKNLVGAFFSSPDSSNLAKVSGHFVTIKPGMRKEQVAFEFGEKLGWNSEMRWAFMTPRPGASLPLSEGSFTPGIYFVTLGMTPREAQAMVNERFTKEVLSRYGTSTSEKIPLNDALTIASIIQRETIGTNGMRMVSGIIWNRLFLGMNLQIDATLQYTKANTVDTASWWPRVASEDKYISSPFNTYMHPGLPPAPIANPSVEAILAALNPIETPCLFYFNDKSGNFHCSSTYAEHIDQLTVYYGR